MTRSRAIAANRTSRLLLDMDEKPESFGVAFNAIENQDVTAWKQGLRMAQERCHRLSTLKHLDLNVFYAGLHQICGRAYTWPTSAVGLAQAKSLISNESALRSGFDSPRRDTMRRRRFVLLPVGVAGISSALVRWAKPHAEVGQLRPPKSG